MIKTIRTIDLFCGAGGSSYGARKAGVKIVAGFDNWEPAQDAFRLNFPEARIYGEDIRLLKPRNIKKDIGEIDLILASPECTSHSVAKGSAVRCEKSKLTAFEVTRFARVFKPKWLVIENVTSMRSWSEHPRFLEELWNCNYYVKQVKLNSKYFEVPQSRNRLFLLCSKERNVKSISVNKVSDVSPAHSIIDWSDKYSFTPLRKNGRAKNTIERADRAINELGSNQSFLLVYYGSDKAGGWQSLDRPLRTITTLDRFALVKPSTNGHIMRMLQPEELKLAMGFMNDYKFSPKAVRRSRVKLMGNGVCPPVMEQIVKSLTVL